MRRLWILSLWFALAATSCATAKVELTCTLPRYSHRKGQCEADTTTRLTGPGQAILYGRRLEDSGWRLLQTKPVDGIWGQPYRFNARLDPAAWQFRVVTSIGGTASCPSDEAYKDLRD